MGGSRWSDDDYYTNSTSRASLSVDSTPFKYAADINAGLAPAVAHPTLDPKGLAMDGKVRESRDSDAHPESNAIVVQLDGTGSNKEQALIIQKKLPLLMGLLLRKSYIPDPQVLFMVVGDANSDNVPIQVGQFESGAEIEEHLSNMYLEGGGGGTMSESYQIGMYFGAYKTSIDCFEKRGNKGYYFIIGDEKTYPTLTRSEMAEKKCGGIVLEADIPTKQIVKDLKEKYNVFFILPKHSSYGGDKRILDHWRELLGPEQVLEIEDSNTISELIATQIGLCEGTTDIDAAKTNLTDVGADAGTALAVVNATSAAYRGGAVTKVAAGALAPSGGGASRI